MYISFNLQNFLALCASDYYNGTLFHRNIKGFIVQTGDPTHTGKGGNSIWGRKFEDEFKDNLKVCLYSQVELRVWMSVRVLITADFFKFLCSIMFVGWCRWPIMDRILMPVNSSLHMVHNHILTSSTLCLESMSLCISFSSRLYYNCLLSLVFTPQIYVSVSG